VTKSHPLDGCRAKVERAKEQVQNLNSEISALLKSGAYSIAGEHDFERKRYVFRPVGPPIPVRISVLAGEIVHHLWSVFDHIVWALATNSGLRYHQMITFPVKDSSEEFERAVKNGAIQGVTSVAYDLIQSFQPYRSADPPNAVTRILYDLDRAEKHRLLIAVAHAVTVGDTIEIIGDTEQDVRLILATPPQAGPFFRGIENGVQVHWIAYQTAATSPKWEIKNNFSPQIAFEKIGSGEFEPIVPILVQLCNSMTGTINEFSAFFP